MREIKFRGLQKGNNVDGSPKTFIYGYLTRSPKRGWTEVGEEDGYLYYIQHSDYVSTQVDRKTVGEFIGRYDKNNTPIFEGDIVRLKEEDGPTEIKHVVYEGVSFDLFPYHISGENTLEWACDHEDGNLLEVIGNIYQDSHLLEVEK